MVLPNFAPILDSRRVNDAACLLRSFASFARDASSCKIRLLNAIGPGVFGYDSVNSSAPPF